MSSANNKKSLGARLGNIANEHRLLRNYKKKYMRNIKTYNFKTVKNYMNYEKRLKNAPIMEVEEINEFTTPSNTSSVISTNTITSTKSNSSACKITPGGLKMKKVGSKWIACGGKTRRTKKSSRVTRRRR